MRTKTAILFSGLFIILLFGFSSTANADRIPPEDMAYTPVVLTQLTVKSTSVKVYVYENTTLYVKKGSKLLVKKSYKTEGVKTVKIKKQKKNEKLKFYLIYKVSGKRGSIVTKKVTAKKMKVKTVEFKAKLVDDLWIKATGNIGDTVYFRLVKKGKREGWQKAGTIISRNKLYFIPPEPEVFYEELDQCYYQVRLKRLNGKYSNIIRVKVPESMADIFY